MSIAMQLSESEVEDFSTATTAEMLGLGSAAIKTRLHRARLFLRRELSSYFDPRAKEALGTRYTQAS
jgi:DNA-directed RNA polymerase specialized sigma24 family protein